MTILLVHNLEVFSQTGRVTLHETDGVFISYARTWPKWLATAPWVIQRKVGPGPVSHFVSEVRRDVQNRRKLYLRLRLFLLLYTVRQIRRGHVQGENRLASASGSDDAYTRREKTFGLVLFSTLSVVAGV